MMEQTCLECGVTVFYDLSLHKCDGKVSTLPNPYGGMSWVEECQTKQRATNGGTDTKH